MITEEKLFEMLSEDQRQDILDTYAAKLKQAVADLQITVELTDSDLEAIKDWIMDSVYGQIGSSDEIVNPLVDKLRKALQ